MASTPIKDALRDRIGKEAGSLKWHGAILLVVGIAALVFPVASTLAATLFVGWILIAAGIVSLFGAFSLRGSTSFLGGLLFGFLYVAAGIYMLTNPLSSAAALTLILAILFLVHGAFELYLAFELRPSPGWLWMLLSALASILLAILIFARWPGSSLVILGILIGVNFISSGIAYLLLGGAVKRVVAQPS